MITPRPTIGDSLWFVHDRFGMFIHWGIYALPARHEWVRSSEQIPEEQYQKYFDHFDPDRYDPRVWAKAAREAGMKYVVVTAKHHDGFCLWDSRYTDYKATNTPHGRDIIRPLVEAFRAEGLRVGFYYSLLDWHHPDFTIDRFHPKRHHANAAQWNEMRDMTRYAAYVRNQVQELLTEFGPVDILWFDFSYPEEDHSVPKMVQPGKGHKEWESERLLALVRDLAPQILVNNRLDLAQVPDDFVTPEQYQPHAWMQDPKSGEPMVWETCQTFSGSWGYHRDETTWKSPGQLIRMLINSVSCGGNLLMNVGPTARGTFDVRVLEAFSVYREWMDLHSRSIYGCSQAEYEAPTGCVYTQSTDRKRLYLHVYAWPFRHIHLSNLAGKVEYAQLLNDYSEITFTESIQDAGWYPSVLTKGALTLNLPVQKPNVIVPVIELFIRDTLSGS